MPLENLTLVQGIPFEQVLAKLKEAELEYSVFEKRTEPYFRYHRIHVKTRSQGNWQETRRITEEKIKELLGRPNKHQPTLHYRAFYKLEPGFDVTQLDGRVTFNQGLLVESTGIDIT